MDFKHTSIKQSALGWVKKSIDDNLATVRAELNIYIEDKDPSILGSVEQKLADLQGVLTMIEQYGAAMLTEEMRSLCKFVAEKEQLDEQALEVLLRAVLQLPDYLEHIQAGHKDIPIAILPLLNDIRAAKNEDLFSEKLLFLPDLSMHMDDSEYDAIDDNSNQASRQLAKKVRPAYQFSLLGLIRDKDVDSNLKRLEKITEIMEERSSSEQIARLWWIVGALIESISRDNLPLGVSTKMLLGKVDQIFRGMMLKGEKELVRQQPIELIKNLLFYIAQPECDGPKSQAIKTAYRLEQFLPSNNELDQAVGIAGPNQELLKTVSDALQADLEQVKSTLEVYVNGDMAKTDQLQDIPRELHIISDTLAMIGLGPQRQLIESQIKMISEVVDGKEQPDQEKLLAMAAELIQVDQALELMQKGQILQAESDEVTTNTASKNFEMDNMLSGVISAALDDIQKIKDAILDFIKDSTKEENIRFCQTLLVETRGALQLLNEDRAVQLTDGLIRYLRDQDIVEFMDTRRLDQLSQVVVSIEYYLEAIGEQRADAGSILDFADTQLELLLAGKNRNIQADSGAAEQENLLIEEDDIEAEEIDEEALANVDLNNMEEELQDQPLGSLTAEIAALDDIGSSAPPAISTEEAPIELTDDVVQDLNQDLQAIQDVLSEEQAIDSEADEIDVQAFEPVAEEALELLIEEDELSNGFDAEVISPVMEAEASAEIEALEIADTAEEQNVSVSEPEQVVSTPANTGQSIAPTSGDVAEAVQIEPVTDEMPVLKPDTDEEILEIYLEEAEEESENIRQLQQDWKLHPEDENALKNIRRAFHTIKGSGRLVGAMKIGEFAWDYENLLNRVLDKTVVPNEQVIEAVGMAAEALPQLVEELKTSVPPTADIPYLRGLARALAEFKANQVFEIRQASMQAPESEATASEASGEGEETGEEPAPVRESVDVNEYELPEVAFESVAPETPELPVEEAAAETEETPPDPFVLSDSSNPPGSGEEVLLRAQPEPSEANVLPLDPELLVIYQQEVESHLNTVNSVLDDSEKEGELVPTESLYRALHTIHGASRTADISTIGQLASLLEKPLRVMLEQGTGLDDQVLELYRQGSEQIHSMTRYLVETRQLPDLDESLRQDLEMLMQQLHNHTVELPGQDNQPSSTFVDTLTMMNEAPQADYDDELVEIFIDEATDLLEMSDHTLQAWTEQRGDDDTAEHGLVMELQRYLHTLKGGAKMAEFHDISDLSHELESLFISVIDGRVDKSDDLIEALRESFDLLQKQVEQAKNRQPLDSSAEQIEQLKELRTGQVAEKKPTGPFVERRASKPQTAQEGVKEERRDPQHNRRSDDLPTTDRRSHEQDIVKVRSELLDNLVNSAGEVSIYRARMEQQVSSFGTHLGELGQTIARLKNQLRALEAETDAQIHFSHRNDAEVTQSFDPLELDRYTQIQELSKALSESVDDLSSLQNILGEQVKDSETLLLQQSRINTDLQDGLIRSRMVRFSGLTSRLRRLVRQTSSELAKKAELVMHGDQHEVDIKVLDRMIAPLEHIIRNAISHGIENPMDRVKKGKPESGKITIDVSRDGSDIVVKISDDGSGVNVDKVRSRALQLGLLGEKEKMDDADVIQFILEPGFSTADSVTQVAGRGVGMDVVDSTIKQLGGTLQISTSSEGTLFTARLPFTLSINQAILVRAGDESYALPLINIEGITRIESDQMQELYELEKPSLDYAGQHYGLYYLSSLLGISQRFQSFDDAAKVPVILLRSGDLRVALHIDEILGNREIVVKPLGRLLTQVKGLSGASILADGMVVLILDINGLIRHGVTTQVLAAGGEATEVSVPETDIRKTVMVVDDSITMRRVATKLLTRNNYDVITAKDGVDALAQLEDSHPDVMLLDIEMPRMDGFELATHMRNEERYRDIPIIMITSRTGSKHREHAMQIGVNKYMGKPYHEEELIENISGLVG